MLKNPFVSLDDDSLEASLISKTGLEREVNADIILHLMLFKERRLYVAAGYDSLFTYCTEKLGFSRSTAFRRKAITDRADQFPTLIDRLRDGRLQLCAAAAIAPHLDDGSAEILMDEVEGLSHREVEAYLIKNWRSKRMPPTSAPAAAAAVAVDGAVGFRPSADSSPDVISGSDTPPLHLQRTIVKAVSLDTNRVNVTMSDATLERLNRARELLCGKSDDEIIQRSLDALLDQIAPERRHERREKRRERLEERNKVEATEKCGTEASVIPTPSANRKGKLADRDRVFAEGGGRCSFRSPNGVQCRSRSRLEIDHIRPWALGGKSDPGNLRPLCRRHNQWLAENTFGPWVRKDTGPKTGRKIGTD